MLTYRVGYLIAEISVCGGIVLSDLEDKYKLINTHSTRRLLSPSLISHNFRSYHQFLVQLSSIVSLVSHTLSVRTCQRTPS